MLLFALYPSPFTITQLYCASIKRTILTAAPQNIQRKHEFTQKPLTSDICKTFLFICSASLAKHGHPT